MNSVGKLRFQPGGVLSLKESVTVRESKKPRFSKYKVIGRGGNLYAYTGAESRTLNLNFSMTEWVYGDLTSKLNKIRSASLGQGGSPIPLVKFSYGPQWVNIKCVLVNYVIKNVEKAGYTNSGSPKQVMITLSLEEVDVPSF